ncbi:hypothetical protein [Pseudarthrobacter sp. S9]|uniref:hypothetical protein n=1 Tax=Pseudarthrobacter sp. S9 TaxID=3418421 RepID=UPI003D075AC5
MAVPTSAAESRRRKLANSGRRGHVLAAALLVPATRTGLTARNLTAHLLPH